MTRYNLVHTFLPMPQAMKIPEAKAAMDKEYKKKLETIPAWQLDKVKSKKEVFLGAQRDKKESPLCNIDGHLSNQKCRVSVRGVSWSEVTTVPKRKSHRLLDLSFSWNSEEDIWKGRKKSNGTKRKRRRVKRTTTTQRTGAHAWMG